MLMKERKKLLEKQGKGKKDKPAENKPITEYIKFCFV